MFVSIWAAWAAALPRPLIAAALAQVLASTAPGPKRGAPAAAIDSVRLLHRARSAQSDFEFLHRANLPVGYGGEGERGYCDVHIGRFCYWSDDGDTSPPPPEAARVRRARDRLLAILDTVAAALPGDDWVAGQRVRYRVEAGRVRDAVETARACRATAWWCDALLGYALHARGDFDAADSAYSDALAAMSERRRCRWTDISSLLDGGLAHEYRKLGCAARDSLARRIWWLAAPLYLVGTRDLRTEQLARATRVRLEQHARSPQITWGDDVAELILRYGWSTWYSRHPPPPGSMQDASITGHDPSPSFDFVPKATAVDSPATLGSGVWNLKRSDAPFRYAPSYLRVLERLQHQIAVFRRGDSAVVLGAFDLRADRSLAGLPLDAGLFVWADDRHEARSVRHDSALVQVFTVTTPMPAAGVSAAVAGLEVFARKERRAARARVGVRIPELHGGPALSDLLLYAPHGHHDPPGTLNDVMPLALGTTRVDARKPLGVYWETYGLPERGVAMQVSLTVTREDRGWFHRAAQALHLVGHDEPLSVTWQEVPGSASGIASRGVAVDLSTLESGTYRIQLTATAPASQPLVRTRDIRVFR